MTTCSCDEIASRLVDYADAELSRSEADQVAGHVVSCDRCRRRLDALRRSLDLARVIWDDSVTELADAAARPCPAPGPSLVRRLGHRRTALIAAGVALLAAAGLFRYAIHREVPNVAQSPEVPELTPAEIEQQIERAGVAAQLLAAADLLAEQPGGEDFACERYRYVAAAYSDTDAAVECNLRLAALCEGRNMP